MVPCCYGNQPKSWKSGKKCLHAGQEIEIEIETVQS